MVSIRHREKFQLVEYVVFLVGPVARGKEGKNAIYLFKKLKHVFASYNGPVVLLVYYAFQKHANSEVQKPTDVCVFSPPSIISADLLGNTQKFTSTGLKCHGL